ncbi:hypothetical protein SB658_23255, partial [Bacillus sp. SIMBA_008]
RTDYARAAAEFSWPEVGERFNWAIDWFDRIARGNERTALWIVEEDGSEERFSFDQLATRSARIAPSAACNSSSSSNCS